MRVVANPQVASVCRSVIVKFGHPVVVDMTGQFVLASTEGNCVRVSPPPPRAKCTAARLVTLEKFVNGVLTATVTLQAKGSDFYVRH